MEVARGGVYWADLNPTRGTEQAGRRPVLVVQTDRANAASPHTIIVPFTTRIRGALLPSHVFVRAGTGGLSEDAVALCEQVRVCDRSRLVQKIGTVPQHVMDQIGEALKAILDLR
ncbi:MAG: type II toxin-antitoxin system PemK/MazF family toxin [Planctomycetes bacterium]|nr:type II toxin-antitoxin system PemK/MazF family toxin [Planctomycetota bacterium]